MTEVSVYPKPVEWPKVTHCLKIFSDETVAALTNTYLPTSDTYETAIFIEKVLQFWKIVSVKEVCGDIRKNDPLKKVKSNVNDANLMYL